MFSRIISAILDFFRNLGKSKVQPSPVVEQTPAPSTQPTSKPEVVVPPAQPTVPPRGVWIWDASELVPNYIDILCKQGCHRVYIKMFDDLKNYDAFLDQSSKEFISQFTKVGIEVWGWGYHFDKRKTIEVDKEASYIVQMVKNGIKGYVFDVEEEVKDVATHGQLKQLIQKVKASTPLPVTLGYTSFGYPEYHSQVPYKMLQDECNCQFPQIYAPFTSGTNDEDAKVAEAFRQHQAMGLNKKPIYPIWCSEPGTAKPSSVSILQKFVDKYPGCSVWRAPGKNEKCSTFNLKYGTEIPVAVPETPKGNFNTTLFNYYSKLPNYNAVYEGVLKFYAAGTSNGCVAFMSEAIRQAGLAVPKGVDSLGENISLVTKPFAEYLINKAKWIKIKDMSQLLPGDVVLTQDDSRYPGYPAHTYMFHSWIDKSRGVAYVIDNQDFTHKRNITEGGGGYNFTPYAYHVRSPA